MRKLTCLILILLADFFTKYWVAHGLPLIEPWIGYPFGGIGLLNTKLLKISIVHTTNTGIAWGLLSNFGGALLVLRILITLALFVYLAFFNPKRQMQMPLTLVLAGAIGNILDFFFYGHVIDMISLIFYQYSYPIFNIADSAIFLGVVGLFFSKIFAPRRNVHSH